MGRTSLLYVLTVLAVVGSGCDVSPYSRFVYTEVDCSQPNCGWLAQQGQVERTGSWHKKEFAFSLVGTPARITRTVDVTTNAACLIFSYLGEIEAGSETRLLLDFNDDGVDDAESVLPVSHWTRQDVSVRAPTDYTKLRISLYKPGPGAAKLTLFSMHDSDDCGSAPVTKLQNGAVCALDSTCSSDRCLLGHCSACGVGGCAEGEACRDSAECIDGACAAQVCRKCAKDGSCGAVEGCSAPLQCAARSCVAGSVPSMTRAPSLDATCGECDADDDCGDKSCVLGRCASCAVDTDCSGGLVCRWLDPFDALQRGCVPKTTSPLPRGALCEKDTDCEGSLSCSSAEGRAKRCGRACGTDVDCGENQLCIAPGARRVSDLPARFATQPRWNELAGRISTCWPRVDYAQPCQLHQQCSSSSWYSPMSCCDGICSGSGSDLGSGACIRNDGHL